MENTLLLSVIVICRSVAAGLRRGLADQRRRRLDLLLLLTFAAGIGFYAARQRVTGEGVAAGQQQDEGQRHGDKKVRNGFMHQ